MKLGVMLWRRGLHLVCIFPSSRFVLGSSMGLSLRSISPKIMTPTNHGSMGVKRYIV
jgi:hypothetical protein